MKAAVKPARLGVGGRLLLSLMSSASLGQAIPVLVTPVLTRLYSPHEFGPYAVYVSVVFFVSAVAAGRYDAGIAVARSNTVALHVAALSLRTASQVSAGLALAAGLLLLQPTVRVTVESYPWLALLPVSIAAAAWSNALTNYSIHIGASSAIFKSELTKSITVAAVQISLGLLGFGAMGLIAGALAAAFVGNLGLLRLYKRGSAANHVTPAGLKETRRAFTDFPRFDVPSTLLNNAAALSTNIGISIVYSSAVLGSYSLAFRFVTLPATTLGASVGRVLQRETASRYHSGRPTRPLANRTALLLGLASLPLFVAAMLVAPQAFSTILGEEWREAGTFAVALAPLMWIKLVASPLSTSLTVTRRQRLFLIWHALFFAATLTTLALAGLMNLSPMGYLWISSLFSACCYIVLLAISMASLSAHDKKTAGLGPARTATVQKPTVELQR